MVFVELRKGTRVTQITKKVGQPGKLGKVVDIRGHDVEVRWDDGHTAVVEKHSLQPAKK